MMYRVIPYKQYSKGAKALAKALGGKVVKLGLPFTPGGTVINWGNTDSAQYAKATVNGVDLRAATNKRTFFVTMKQCGLTDIIPRFWLNRNDVPDNAYPVVCRKELAGHSGAGIVIAHSPGELVNAPLYVQYIKKKDEYRIHVGRRESGPTTISIQRKARRLECETPNWEVRNHQNGFVYVRNDVNPPESVVAAAHRAFGCTALDFGAVDVVYNEKEGRAYVLEINTAPGLEGTTVEDYATFFRNV